ncbi:MAG: homocysteine S-methyltransferase family protein [Anaerolineaceae bacterium]|nr:homocysteine S-methyltransferase family protein [Anaerolineaceae bacterium]
MSGSRFLDRLNSGQKLVADGATGTNLQARGLERGQPSDLWVLEKPEEIVRLHHDFVAAGADIILTASFGGTTICLKHIGLAERAVEINRRAVELAKQASAGTDVLVAGSMGPTGEILKPLGRLDEADAAASFAEQARVLTEAGVDLLVIETQFDLTEASAAVKGARSASSLPLVVSFSYDRGTRTMNGVKPVQMAREISALGVDVLGINCGRSLEDNLKALKELREVSVLPIWFKPNAGLPRLDDDEKPVYDVTPEMMAAQVPEWLAAGARIIGGCCGTSPEHLHLIAQAVKA